MSVEDVAAELQAVHDAKAAQLGRLWRRVAAVSAAQRAAEKQREAAIAHVTAEAEARIEVSGPDSAPHLLWPHESTSTNSIAA